MLPNCDDSALCYSVAAAATLSTDPGGVITIIRGVPFQRGQLTSVRAAVLCVCVFFIFFAVLRAQGFFVEGFFLERLWW